LRGLQKKGLQSSKRIQRGISRYAAGKSRELLERKTTKTGIKQKNSKWGLCDQTRGRRKKVNGQEKRGKKGETAGTQRRGEKKSPVEPQKNPGKGGT